MSNGEAFQKPDDAPFDINAWLDGATLPERSVTIYLNAALYADYQELEQRFFDVQARVQAADDDGPGPDAALGEKSPRSELTELAEQMKDVYDRIQASRKTIRIRAITETEREKLAKTTKGHDDIFAARALIAAGSVEPKLTEPDVRKLQDAVGNAQYMKLVQAANAVNGYSGDDVVPDFSPLASALLSTRES